MTMTPKFLNEELAFNRRFWRFKVVAYFFPQQKYKQLSHFSVVKNCSVKQIQFGHVKQVVFNSEAALAECIDRIDLFNKKYGRVQRAFIYDRSLQKKMPDGTIQEGKAIIKFENDVLTYMEPVKFNVTDRNIVREVVHREDANGNKTFTLHAAAAEIDFKKEISQNLYKKRNIA